MRLFLVCSKDTDNCSSLFVGLSLSLRSNMLDEISNICVVLRIVLGINGV